MLTMSVYTCILTIFTIKSIKNARKFKTEKPISFQVVIVDVENFLIEHVCLTKKRIFSVSLLKKFTYITVIAHRLDMDIVTRKSNFQKKS